MPISSPRPPRTPIHLTEGDIVYYTKLLANLREGDMLIQALRTALWERDDLLDKLTALRYWTVRHGADEGVSDGVVEDIHAAPVAIARSGAISRHLAETLAAQHNTAVAHVLSGWVEERLDARQSERPAFLDDPLLRPWCRYVKRPTGEWPTGYVHLHYTAPVPPDGVVEVQVAHFTPCEAATAVQALIDAHNRVLHAFHFHGTDADLPLAERVRRWSLMAPHEVWTAVNEGAQTVVRRIAQAQPLAAFDRANRTGPMRVVDAHNAVLRRLNHHATLISSQDGDPACPSNPKSSSPTRP